jgi:hypothetical protein
MEACMKVHLYKGTADYVAKNVEGQCEMRRENLMGILTRPLVFTELLVSAKDSSNGKFN